MKPELIVVQVPFCVNEDGKWAPVYSMARRWSNKKATMEKATHHHLAWDEFALIDKVRGMVLFIPDPEWCETLSQPFGLLECTSAELERMQTTGMVERKDP